VTVPATIGITTLNALVSQAVPFEHELRVGPVDFIEVISADLSSSGDRLLVDTRLRVSSNDSDLMSDEVNATFSAQLQWDAAAQTMVLDDFRIENGLNAFLRKSLQLAQFLGLVTRTIEIPLAGAQAALRADMTAALNRPLSDTISLNGTTTQVQLLDLEMLDTGLSATAAVEGALDITLKLVQ